MKSSGWERGGGGEGIERIFADEQFFLTFTGETSARRTSHTPVDRRETSGPVGTTFIRPTESQLHRSELYEASWKSQVLPLSKSSAQNPPLPTLPRVNSFVDRPTSKTLLSREEAETEPGQESFLSPRTRRKSSGSPHRSRSLAPDATNRPLEK